MLAVPIERYREGVDALLERVGGENLDRSIRAVRRGGRAVDLVGEPPGRAPDGVRVTAIVGRRPRARSRRGRASARQARPVRRRRLIGAAASGTTR
jgi:NADPH:quinone reductase-like Zn-dependent oxidoreductase